MRTRAYIIMRILSSQIVFFCCAKLLQFHVVPLRVVILLTRRSASSCSAVANIVDCEMLELPVPAPSWRPHMRALDASHAQPESFDRSPPHRTQTYGGVRRVKVASVYARVCDQRTMHHAGNWIPFKYRAQWPRANAPFVTDTIPVQWAQMRVALVVTHTFCALWHARRLSLPAMFGAVNPVGWSRPGPGDALLDNMSKVIRRANDKLLPVKYEHYCVHNNRNDLVFSLRRMR